MMNRHPDGPSLRSAERFPYRVREVENLWIVLSDGCRLAARMWLPENAEQEPVPAILEYLPYRKRDLTAPDDTPMHTYFAGHGYACLRVDIRGTGDSDGLLLGEYLKQEQDDGVEIIAWVSQQPWCSGAVGMIGISWGGFNGLQIAARRPPALKAVISVESTDDRYADEVHFMGGTLLSDNLRWGSTFISKLSLPPDPALVGDRWRKMWMNRLQSIPFFPAEWLHHQTRDAFWEHGSVCEDYSSIECAVFAVGGWIDGYTNSVLRLLQNLPGPRKGMIGPWAHRYPMVATPGPQIDFLHEAVRWWDKWLKGIETGIMDGPMLTVWMQDSFRPQAFHDVLPGRWIGEASWPPRAVEARQFYLTSAGLAENSAPESARILLSPESVGLFAGVWNPLALFPDESGDQRSDDGRSLVFDTQTLDERCEILGAPLLDVELTSDRPNAKLVVRLCDVHPDGASTRVSYGVLNITHRESHRDPSLLEPNRRYRVTLALNHTAYSFAPGHRIRVALSTTYWPVTWPSPERATLTLFTGKASLTLPVRPLEAPGTKTYEFPPPERGAVEPQEILRESRGTRSVEQDLASGMVIYRISDDNGCARSVKTGITVNSTRQVVYQIRDDDPLSARMESRWMYELGRDNWSIRTTTRTIMTATRDGFRVQAELDAFENGTRVHSRNWAEVVPRQLV
jgi:putative CocE/NonD family hydrolase